MSKKPNLVVVVSDTLRVAELGCYGNPWIRTPNLDAFARQSVRFTRAYPESLPTIVFRRALHTGRRTYPLRNYKPVKWDVVYLPGWQPMAHDEDTLAENLAAAGYHTGFASDTFVYFSPAFNFHRGFWQFEFVRGKQQDRWQSPHAVPQKVLRRYTDPWGTYKPQSIAVMHCANTAQFKTEEDTTTAKVFKWGMKFAEDNRKAEPFFLLMDCFDPHEPWEAPEKYFRLYGDPNYKGRRFVSVRYGPAHEFGYAPEEIAHIRAHYCGLVTLVDTWFGKFIKRLDALGLAENTAVFLLSDHGTNFCENPRNVVGKPGNAMYPTTMQNPLFARLPGRRGAGKTCNEFVYTNIDVAATAYDLAGIKSAQGIDGQSLVPLLTRNGKWSPRDYVTCRYDHSLCYIDDKNWVMTDIDGKPQEIFDLASDARCQQPLDLAQSKGVFARAWKRLLRDAKGEFPDYRKLNHTDAIGQKAK
jgi:arylsulfatase A-like enzyme